MNSSDQLPAFVSRETKAQLDLYVREVEKWNRKINLVSKATSKSIWKRHILDSIQLFPFVETNTKIWADLGSGAGFPGLVLAILAHQSRPDINFVLVERDVRKSEFLRHVARLTNTRTVVSTDSIESLAPLNADVISARALAPLDKLLSLAYPHLKDSGRCLFLKGKNTKSELTKARTLWHMDVEQYPSATDPEATILKIENIKNA